MIWQSAHIRLAEQRNKKNRSLYQSHIERIEQKMRLPKFWLGVVAMVRRLIVRAYFYEVENLRGKD